MITMHVGLNEHTLIFVEKKHLNTFEGLHERTEYVPQL